MLKLLVVVKVDKFDLFAKVLENKNYIFHVHTTYTDGKSSLDDYYNAFKKRTLIFTEHIRLSPQYDWEEFLNSVHDHGFMAGFEAKVLPNGLLDIPKQAVDKADVLAVAVHSYPEQFLNDLIFSLRKVFKRYKDILPLVWVHPHTSSIEMNFKNRLKYIKEVTDDFENEIYVEFNLKRMNFSKKEIDILKDRVQLIKGYDAHSVDDVLNFEKRGICLK